MRFFVLALMLGVLATGAAAQESPLAGAWTAVEAERDGAPATDVVGHRLTFEGATFEIVKPDGVLIYAGTFRSDPSAEPHAIDFANTAGGAAGTDWAGIWRLDGTTLTTVDSAPRPEPPAAGGLRRPRRLGVHHGRLRARRLIPVPHDPASTSSPGLAGAGAGPAPRAC